jgi:hypothetical protein
MFESLDTPPPSCQMDGVQEEMWCIVNTPSLNFNFRLSIHHFPRGLQRTHTCYLYIFQAIYTSAMSYNVWHKKNAHLSRWEI